MCGSLRISAGSLGVPRTEGLAQIQHRPHQDARSRGGESCSDQRAGKTTWSKGSGTRFQTIKDGFQAQRNMTIVAVPAPDGGIEYMYAEGQLLVRDKYVEQVSQIFSPKVPFDRGLVGRVVPGVSLLTQDTKISSR